MQNPCGNALISSRTGTLTIISFKQLFELFFSLFCYRYGAVSIEVGHELVKFSDILEGQITENGYNLKTAEELNEILKRASEILLLHYGNWHHEFNEVQEKLKQVSILLPPG